MSVNASAVQYSATPSIYGGSLFYGYNGNLTMTVTFDSEQFNQIASISGTESVSREDITATAGSVTGTIQMNSPLSSGSQSGSFTYHGHDYYIPAHNNSVSLNVNSSNGVYYHSMDIDAYNLIMASFSPSSADIDSYYEVVVYVGNPSSTTGTMVNFLQSFDIASQNSWHGVGYTYRVLVRGRDLVTFTSDGTGFLGCDTHLKLKVDAPTSPNATIIVPIVTNVYKVSESIYNNYAGSTVHDSGTQSSIDTGNVINQQGNTIAQENSNTNKDTNNKVTSFFNAFWDNLLHIFVPEDGFFSSWFNDLNDFFAAKLGFLYAPFDFIISFFNGVLNTVGTQEHGFTIPALSWEGTEFCPEVHFSFDTFSDQFPQLQEAVYFFSDVVIILALMRGIKSKLDLVMGVHEE